MLRTASYLSAFAPVDPLPGMLFSFSISSWDWNTGGLGPKSMLLSTLRSLWKDIQAEGWQAQSMALMKEGAAIIRQKVLVSGDIRGRHSFPILDKEQAQRSEISSPDCTLVSEEAGT